MDQNSSWLSDFLNRRQAIEPANTSMNTERACNNCTHHESCWIADNWEPERPSSFTLRNSFGWSETRFLIYMKRVFAQTCSNYLNRHINASVARVKSGWDK